MPRILVLTSTALRHQFLIQSLSDSVNVVGVFQEEKAFRPEEVGDNAEDREVIAAHFAAREASEQHHFSAYTALRLPEGVFHATIEPKTINDPEHLEQMISLEPDVLVVFGTGILRDPIIEQFQGSIINLHLGLSPYYRGSGTNFWPLVNNEPEYVGATIHYLDAGIDSGEMICHVRPEIDRDDGPHDLGNKTIIAAAKALPAVVDAHVGGRVLAAKQHAEEGKLYLRKHFCADAVRTMQKNFQEGMISQYLEQKSERDRSINLLPVPA